MFSAFSISIFLCLLCLVTGVTGDWKISVRILELSKVAEDATKIHNTLALTDEISSLQQVEFDNMPPWGCAKTECSAKCYRTDQVCCSPPSTTIMEITKCALQAGITIHPRVVLQKDTNKMKLLALEKIRRNQTIISVPIDSTLSAHAETPPNSLKYVADFWPQALLAVRILQESDTPFRKCIGTFPQVVPSHPLWYIAEHIAILKESTVYSEVVRTIQACASLYAYFYTKFTEPTPFTYDAFRWAFAMALSRSVAVTKTQYLLIPILDLVAHSNDPNTETFDSMEADRVELRTVETVRSNVRIMRQYSHSTLDASFFLKTYGMVNIRCTGLGIAEAPSVLKICEHQMDSRHIFGLSRAAFFTLKQNRALFIKFQGSVNNVFSWYKFQLTIKVKRMESVLKREELNKRSEPFATIRLELEGEIDLLKRGIDRLNLEIN